jgi:RHH-type proline utilization regulon transcriptional repressor/proline dehydrogenase/delta 1-pyrroline-5-carboxylate dehydrogenase
MKSSQAIETGKEMILSVKAKPLSLDERINKAIELAAIMLTEAKRIETPKEKQIQTQLAKMMADEKGKNFLIQMTDQSFRSEDSKRVVNQIKFLINKFGSPKFLDPLQRFGMNTVKSLGQYFPSLFTSLTKYMIREQTSQVILPGEASKLIPHIKARKKEGVRVNLNRLGEAILGEEEALKRLQTYLDDLAKPEIDYISVKISTICSQLNLLSWEETLEVITSRLKILYRAAKQNRILKNGVKTAKFVNLDMEEYRDLNLTVEGFKRVLETAEFENFSAGIVLQAYVPDSYLVQQELTIWAMKRVNNGGAPIKIRIVKGANLAMEQVESSIRLWAQPQYDQKSDVDANYKRMLHYGAQKEHAKAANLGIASHNLFDIAYAMLICSENEIEPYVCFEMLEGMADHMRRVVQGLSGDMLLYCPAATKEEFQNAVAYLVRRLDENTAPGNFLREAFSLTPNSEHWKKQAALFAKSCHDAASVSFHQRRTQNRFLPPNKLAISDPFENEADTDFSLTQNRKWAEKIVSDWSSKNIEQIPLEIGEQTIITEAFGTKPNVLNSPTYRYSLADSSQIAHAIETAVAAKDKYAKRSLVDRMEMLAQIAHELRVQRGDLIGAMIVDGRKTVTEADVEISEAIDFAEYYLRSMKNFSQMEGVTFSPKGVILIASPWNFPCSIPLGGITAALITGNSVLFKPAEEAILVGYMLAKICWKAGVPQDLLQFIVCKDEPEGSLLIKDKRVNAVVLTGATDTAKLFLKMRPGLDLMAETGGKNAMIITSLSDRDLSVKDLVQSAFSFSGQKCSACSLGILEAEVYDDLKFRELLKSATKSLKVGSPFNLASKVNPLIGEPNKNLEYGLTTLEDGEEWLLKPVQDSENPYLWSPGIRLHSKPNSKSHKTEFFGPVLTLMRANDLKNAVELANGTSYGLTSGLQSLDEREQAYWLENIEAGNCYINRGITGAVVQRQPFGGCKESSFGFGLKAGGPNYLSGFMHKKETKLIEKEASPASEVKELASLLEDAPSQDIDLFNTSLKNYAYFWNHEFSQKHDVSLCIGQDNFLQYVPQKNISFRVQPDDKLVDILRVIAAAKTCGTKIEISSFKKIDGLNVREETEKSFIERLKTDGIKRVRMISPPSENLKIAFANVACNIISGPVLGHGRLELLNYLREVAISIDYHRYGNLGDREGEKRTPLLKPEKL